MARLDSGIREKRRFLPLGDRTRSMEVALTCSLLSVLAFLTLACADSPAHPAAVGSSVRIPASEPPSPATWSRYPHFSDHACWARPFQKAEIPTVLRAAPSLAPRSRLHPLPARLVAERLLAGFGDRRYIRAIRFRPAPPAVGKRVHTLYAGGHPPSDALAAEIVTDGEPAASARWTPRQALTDAVVNWEVGLIAGALRDDLCSAGGAPLVTWSGAGISGLSQRVFALEQQFPKISPVAFRRRVALVGQRYGFRVLSLRLLMARQIAPLLIVRTSRPRKAFVHDIPSVMRLLDPTLTFGNETALTFEGFFFGVKDRDGPFAEVENVNRGMSESGEWSSDPCDYPYDTLAENRCPGTHR